MLYRTVLRMLGDLVSPKALEKILEAGARERGKSLGELDQGDLIALLKRDVYKRLQLSVPPHLAKKRIQDVLGAFELESVKNTAIRNEDAILAALENSSRRFALYFDWPESQKLRALLGVARTEMEAGKSVPGLLDEGMGLVAALERRLNEGLVAQANDLAELRAELVRFSGVGGPKLRRLENLISQVEAAQSQDALSQAELERARQLALELRKLVESSVISPATQQPPEELPDPAALPAEAQRRLQELDREAEARELRDLTRDNADVLRLRPDLDEALSVLRTRGASGDVLGAALTDVREQLRGAREALLSEQRAELETLAARLDALPGGHGEARDDARLALQVTRGTLDGGALATAELARVRAVLQTLEQQGSDESRSALLALQRETFELEEAARNVRGAEEELAPRLREVRAALDRGELVALDGLWAQLERRMATHAQEREAFDDRVDRVIDEYDRYRHLAGETIQRLGRQVEHLRRVRRLGQISVDARSRFEEQLVQAEALLSEARAEFEAARELTSTFGADALSDLLGVFDEVPSGGAPEPVLAGSSVATARATSITSQPAEPLAAALSALAVAGDAQLALLRDGMVSWGNVDAVTLDAARELTGGARRMGALIVNVELEHGGLLLLPLPQGAALLARVPDAASLASWREQLLQARPGLL